VKKVRISLRDSSKKWTLHLYESLVSFTYLHSALSTKDTSFKNIVTLNKGEFLEIEWLGADYCQIDDFGVFLDEKATRAQMMRRCDNVRIGKCVRKLGRNGFDYITGYTGWIPGDDIPWNPRNAPDYLKVIELKGRLKPRINFSELFESSESKEDFASSLFLDLAEESGIC